MGFQPMLAMFAKRRAFQLNRPTLPLAVPKLFAEIELRAALRT
jgi:hypothetical protein